MCVRHTHKQNLHLSTGEVRRREGQGGASATRSPYSPLYPQNLQTTPQVQPPSALLTPGQPHMPRQAPDSTVHSSHAPVTKALLRCWRPGRGWMVYMTPSGRLPPQDPAWALVPQGWEKSPASE